MSEPKGFGKTTKPSKKAASPGSQKRKKAQKQYDNLSEQGFPEFNIFVRLPEKPDQWLPVGSIAVKRSSAVNQALFQNEVELQKGALRLFPRLTKRKDELEYGYRLKDKAFADEPIQLAQRPAPSLLQKLRTNLQSWIERLRPGQPIS